MRRALRYKFILFIWGPARDNMTHAHRMGHVIAGTPQVKYRNYIIGVRRYFEAKSLVFAGL